MPDEDDQNLLQCYRRERSEQAFRALVARHLGAVHATALRCTGGRAALAEDITQAVFVELARKAAALPEATLPGGWLHRCARFKSIEALRAETRRRHYETAAACSFPAQSGGPEDPAWLDLTPVLDEALDRLPEPARQPLILRFYERRSLKDVGATLGISEDAAQKRIQRALESLRGALAKRGVTSNAGTLAPVLLRALSPQAAPGLVASVSAGAWQAGAAGSLVSSFSLLPLYLAMNAKTVILVVVAVVAIAVPLAYQQRTISAQAERIAELQRKDSAGPVDAGLSPVGSRPGRAVAGRDGKQGISAIAQALEEPDPVLRMERFSRLLRDLRAPDARALADLLEAKKKGGAELGGEEQLFLSAWGGIDGQAAVGYLGEKGRAYSEDAATVMSSWAARDLAGALDWLSAQPGGGSDMLASGVADSWAAVDLEAASHWVEARPATDMRGGMEHGLFDRYLATRGMDGAKRWYEQMPPGAYRQYAADLIAVETAKAQPEEGMDWLVQHGDPPGPGHELATMDTMSKLVEKDLPGAETWLARNPDAPEYDAAAEVVVSHFLQSDPEAAAKWAATIHDEAKRERALSPMVMKISR